MKTLNDNSMSDLIYLFIDGESDNIQQQMLFKELANNTDLQLEFQQALEITRGFAGDKASTYPSAELTKNVFAKAGFSTPVSPNNLIPISETGDVITSNVVKSSFFQRHLLNIFSAIGAALLTTALFLLFINPVFYGNNDDIYKGNGNNFSVNTNQNTSNEQSGNKSAQNQVPLVSSYETSGNAQPQTKIIYRIKYIEVPARNNSSNVINTDSEDKNNVVLTDVTDSRKIETSQRIDPKTLLSSRLSNENIPDANPLIYKDISNQLLSISNNNIPNRSYEINTVKRAPLGIELEFCGVSGLAYFPVRDIESYPKDIFNNVRFAIRKNLSEHHSISVMTGKEDFQMYSLLWNKTSPVFTKEPNIFWAGAGYRYTFDNIAFLNLKPYSEIVVGGSKFGMISKGIIGFTYIAEDALNFYLGFEGTLQTYELQSKLKAATKIGLIYTIGIRF